jgi:GH25 family lysozyme M1 (1,4-beta-N-acetylmuramidase)
VVLGCDCTRADHSAITEQQKSFLGELEKHYGKVVSFFFCELSDQRKSRFFS